MSRWKIIHSQTLTDLPVHQKHLGEIRLELASLNFPRTGSKADQRKGDPVALPAAVASESAAAQAETANDVTSVGYFSGAKNSTRPVIFCFNGGPGSSSMWLHFGAVGPYRIDLDNELEVPARTRVIENDGSLLMNADLVFVDPPATGFSASISGDGPSDLDTPFSVDGDAEWLSRYVLHYVDRMNLWDRPIYLLGESYGGLRVSVMAEKLMNQGLGLLGLIYVAPALDFALLEEGHSNELPHAVYIEAYSDTAAFHGRLESEHADVYRKDVQNWIISNYLGALYLGNRQTQDRLEESAEYLSKLTGLDPLLWRTRNLRVDNETYRRHVLPQRIVGRLDSRFSAPLLLEPPDYFDPSFEQLKAVFAQSTSSKLRSWVNTETMPSLYAPFSAPTGERWRWDMPKGRGGYYPNAIGAINRTLNGLPHLRILTFSGRYDLAVPVAAVDYSLSRLFNAEDRVAHHVFDAGHMVYLGKENRERFLSTCRTWLTG